jgi:hypothetical protein
MAEAVFGAISGAISGLDPARYLQAVGLLTELLMRSRNAALWVTALVAFGAGCGSAEPAVDRSDTDLSLPRDSGSDSTLPNEDTGAVATDATASDSSPPETKQVALIPIDGTSLFENTPIVQVTGASTLPTEVLALISLSVDGGAAVEAELRQQTVGPYINVSVKPKVGTLSGAYRLRVQPLPAGWGWHASQPLKADGSAEVWFTTQSQPKANRVAACGTKLLVEYSEKVQPAGSGDITVEYANEPKNAGCTMNAVGTAPVAAFAFSCASVDATRPLTITANTLTGTAGVSAPAVSKTLNFGPPIGECAYAYVR